MWLRMTSRPADLTEYEYYELGEILDRILGSADATGYEILDALEAEGWTVIPK